MTYEDKAITPPCSSSEEPARKTQESMYTYMIEFRV